MANGRVITGFSRPYVALYGKGATNEPEYTEAMILARGVDVSIEPESGDANNYYGDNEIIESVAGEFTGGTLTLTVDGLNANAESLVFGLPTPDSVTVGQQTVNAYRYGDGMTIPYVGVGFVIRYMSGGVTTYVPVIMHRVKFNIPSTSAATQEDAIDWQSQELTATIYRDESATHNWKTVFEAQTTEDAAVAVLTSVLSA